MKRLNLLIIGIALCICLCACVSRDSASCAFYYLRTVDTMVYGQQDALIAPVYHELADQNAHLSYLLGMYLNSPVPEKFRSPFPAGTTLEEVSLDGNTLVVELSEAFCTLEDIELSLGCACLCTTCFELTDAETICIRSGQLELFFQRDSFALLDHVTPTE